MATKHQQPRSNPPDVIIISSDESENESETDFIAVPDSSGKRNDSRKKPKPTSGRKLAVKETPSRQPLLRDSSMSSASLSSTTSSIFDSNSKTLDTPITPPQPDSTTSSNAKIASGVNHDTLPYRNPRSLSYELSYFQTTPSLPSRPSTPDVQNEGIKDKGIIEESDLASMLSDMILEDSPSDRKSKKPASRTSKSKVKTTNEMRQPCHATSSSFRNTVDHERPESSHNRKGKSTSSSGLSEETGVTSKDDSAPLNRRLSPPKSIHKRSKSAPKLQSLPEVEVTEASPSTEQADNISDSGSAVQISAPKPRKRDPSQIPPPNNRSRSRSTGSIPETKDPSPSTEICTEENETLDLANLNSKRSQAISAEDPISNLGSQAKQERKRSPWREYPNFELWKEKKSKTGVKNEILRVIQRKEKEKQSESKLLADVEDGYIYIFRCNSFEKRAPGHLKIGMTKNEITTRVKHWEKQCHIVATIIEDKCAKRFRHYGIVEKIVHAELWNQRKKYRCGCGTQHQLSLTIGARDFTGHEEWFQIGKTNALEVVEKWRSWVIRRRPYNSNGTLRACWRWKCEQVMKRDEVDWDAFREFGWLETCRCCTDHLWELAKQAWPRRRLFKLWTLEFFLLLFGIAVLFGVSIAGFSMLRFCMLLVALCLYIIGWFNFV